MFDSDDIEEILFLEFMGMLDSFKTCRHCGKEYIDLQSNFCSEECAFECSGK